MKEPHRYDTSQWIPWEIYYSLRKTTRSNYQSQRNAILAVALPDCTVSYNYAIEEKYCCSDTCTLWKTDSFFTIIQRNMFNRKDKKKSNCLVGDEVYKGFNSYIHLIKWEDFITNISFYIQLADFIKGMFTDDELYINVNK